MPTHACSLGRIITLRSRLRPQRLQQGVHEAEYATEIHKQRIEEKTETPRSSPWATTQHESKGD